MSNESARTGDLRQEPLARLLYRLYQEGLTGILIVGEGATERRVYLHAGRPVAAVCPSAVENAARILLEMGVVSQDLYARSLLMTLETGEPQTAVLEQMGMTEEEVRLARTRQSWETLIRLFRVRAASISIQVGDHEYAREQDVPNPSALDPHRIIYHGIRACYDLERVREEIRKGGAIFRLRREAAPSLAAYDLDEDARTVVDKLSSGFWDPVSLEAMTGVGDLAVGRVLCALQATEALERRSTPEPLALIAEPTPVQDLPAGPGSYRLSGRNIPSEGRRQRLTVPPRSAADPSSADDISALRERITTMSLRLDDLNNAELLQVSPDATREQIEAAYAAQRALFDISGLTSPDLSKVRRAGEAILERLQRAHASLLRSLDDTRQVEGRQDH